MLKSAVFFLLSMNLGLCAIPAYKKVDLKTATKLRLNKSPSIKVLIARDVKKFNVEGHSIDGILHVKKDRKSFNGRQKIKVDCNKYSYLFDRVDKPMLLASLNSRVGVIKYKNDNYRGVLSILSNSATDSCNVVNEISIESYLSSLLSKEMNAVWPIEVLKAQAVAARTYAIHMINSKQVNKIAGHESFYDIESSEKHQVFGNYDDETIKTIKAAKDTEGEVLHSKSGKLTPAFYHAKCGGRTLNPEQVWTNPVSGYKSVKCPHCKGHGKKGWDYELSKERLLSLFKWQGIKIPNNFEVAFAPDKLMASKIRFYVGDKVITLEKSLFRRYFGRIEFPSNRFIVKKSGKMFKFYGRGLGHGVGMCQLGALDLAQKGWGYKEILSYYFPGHVLNKIY